MIYGLVQAVLLDMLSFMHFWQMGITYIAQVLRRNRTLKVLNLSENKLDVQCLVAIAEALVSDIYMSDKSVVKLALSEVQLVSRDFGSQQAPMLWSELGRCEC